MKPIKIKRKSRKTWLALIASLAFMAFGCWFVAAPATFKTVPLATPTVVFIAGVATILFFAKGAWHALVQLLDRRPAVEINEKGVTDNAIDYPLGFISWESVTGIRKFTAGKLQFVLIDLHSPEEFMDAETDASRKEALQLTYKNCGTPVSISSIGLGCSAESLEILLKTALKNYRKNL